MIDLETLHGLIDDAQRANPNTEFNVRLVNANDPKQTTLNVTEIYINPDTQNFYILFDGSK